MATVKLFGNLSRFANSLELDVSTTSECIQALCEMLDGFKAVFVKSHIKITVNNRVLTTEKYEKNLLQTIDDDSVINIIPFLHGGGGAKSMGIIQTVIGATLIVVGVITGQVWLTAIGVSLMLGGIVQMLTKPPTMDDKIGTESKKQKNTAFSNLDNVVAQGQILPLIYGTMLTGSRVISIGSTSHALHILTPEEKRKEAAMNNGKVISETREL